MVRFQPSTRRVFVRSTALVLQACYVSALVAVLSGILFLATEFYDRICFEKVRKMSPANPAEVQHLLRGLHASAAFSAIGIGFLAASTAFFQTGQNYFLPLFFLLTAAIFAAMNNHQVLSALVIRLAIYGAVFMLIPIWDLLQSGPEQRGAMWLHFFTSIFVLYFIGNCARTVLYYDRTRKRHLQQLKIENERARAALVAKSEFLSTVSHELRTPLTSIKASLDMTLIGALGEMPQHPKWGIRQRASGPTSCLGYSFRKHQLPRPVRTDPDAGAPDLPLAEADSARPRPPGRGARRA